MVLNRNKSAASLALIEYCRSEIRDQSFYRQSCRFVDLTWKRCSEIEQTLFSTTKQYLRYLRNNSKVLPSLRDEAFIKSPAQQLINKSSPLSPEVLEDSRQVLVAANMQPDDPFPLDDKIKEGWLDFTSSSSSVPPSCSVFIKLVLSTNRRSVFPRGGEHGVLRRRGASFSPYRPPLLRPELRLGRAAALGAELL